MAGHYTVKTVPVLYRYMPERLQDELSLDYTFISPGRYAGIQIATMWYSLRTDLRTGVVCLHSLLQ
jgi:hypothetical protein